MNNKFIIDKLLSGNRKVLEEVYVKNRQPFIHWIIKKYSISLDDAKELYQLTIVIFYENVISGRLKELTSSLKTYLFSIGTNKLREQWKKNQRFSDLSDWEPFDLLDPANKSHEDLESSIRLINTCLTEMGDPCKRLLEAFYYHQQNMETIKENMNYKNTDAVKTKKYKCMMRLKTLFFQRQLNKV